MATSAIRRLDGRDATTWRALRLRALREEPSAFLSSFDEVEPRTIEDIAGLLDGQGAVFGAFDGETLVGSVGVARHEQAKARHRAVLWGMYVAPETRQRGHGRALVAAAIAHARTLDDVDQLELSVAITAQDARALYRRAGFIAHGTQPYAMKLGDTYVTDELMRLPLRAGIARDDDADLVERLAARPPSAAVPVLLELARRQAARKRPAQVRAQYERDPFVAPSPLDQRAASRLDAVALEAAAEFDAVLLSPVAPLATCAAISPSHQDRIVSTMRGTEVVSDPTNVMALECARRLSARGEDVRLCTVHQTVRAQRFPAGRGFTQHFRMFALAEAGRARPDHGFEVDAFVRHVRVFWRLFDAWGGERFRNRTAKLLFAESARPIHARLLARLAAELPALRLDEGPLESGYYAGLRLLLGADAPSGQQVNLSDTGLFDWMARLASDRRLRFVASGLGLQLLPLVFGEGRL